MKVEPEMYIGCPRFGGQRLAPACAHYDRYRFCRRSCKNLERFIEAHPDIDGMLKVVQEAEAKRKEKEAEEQRTSVFLHSKFSGRGMPDPKLSCKYCKFIGKTERGLCIHYKRTHKLLAPPRK
jgi:hypothetical protein